MTEDRGETSTLDKAYRPGEVEGRQYARWEQAGAFSCGRADGVPYTIAIPPPNVTGTLHMGHALNNTLQDVLVRWRRMQGRDVLWQPGTDHAGIATQMVVERQLAKQGIALARGAAPEKDNQKNIGRDDFIAKVWEWKAESGGAITGQLRRLGASLDWRRERFTMDEGLSAAVRKVFVDLYKQGLIYRDKRLVNWDPVLQTAISDLEVESKEVKGHLWHIRYPIDGAPDEAIVVATTRPETMLGDSGVAVHPDDERYRHLVGRHAVLPLVGRKLKVVADAYSDPTKGTGAVKITPAHDFNDFEVGRRHGLELINIFTADAKLNDSVPPEWRGLDGFEARKRIVAALEEAGALVKIEPHAHTVPHGDRSGAVVEPWLMDQWYCDAKTLANPAIEAVEKGHVVFVPKQWDKTYYEWMRNIQPWAISRQLWWGHQIPAWYGPDGRIFVELDEAAAHAAARTHYGKDVALRRDLDVLDTWFSSALWPFSTLGWPEQSPELARYYPTDVLVTGFDIIFFWVARMMMMGLHFMADGKADPARVPFRTVYVHALVRDARGQKMSKSKGNVIDPLQLIDKFGCDALRFTLTALAVPGRDVKLAEPRVEGYRNFVTKLWNAARYCQMNGCHVPAGFDLASATLTVNRWIAGELSRAIAATEAALETFRFHDAAATLYQFTWGTFCDWYLEFSKPILTGTDETAKTETRAVTGAVLRDLLRLLQPIMPFVTEELWEKLDVAPGRLLMLADWPRAGAIDEAAAAEMNWVVEVVSQVRTVRSEMNVPAGTRLPLFHREASATAAARLVRHDELIRRLARLESIAPVSDAGAKGVAQIAVPEATLVLPLAGVIDAAAERTRLTRDADKLAKEIDGIDRRLASADFVAKADPEVVEDTRERRAELAATRVRLATALERIAGL